MELRRQNKEIISPRVVHLVAYLLMSLPLTYIVFLGALYNLSPVKLAKIFFSVHYIGHSLLALWTGWSLLHMKGHAWHSFLLLIVLMILEQFYVAFVFAENHFVQLPLAIACGFFFLLLYIVKSELRVPYFSPRIAWWESDPRFKISVPAKLTTPDHFFEGEIMDISTGGCFLKTKAALNADQVIHLRFSLFEKGFEYAGRVVWRTEATVTLPKGVGIRFIGIDKKNAVELKGTIKKLRSHSEQLQRQRREETAVSVQQKIENLLDNK